MFCSSSFSIIRVICRSPKEYLNPSTLALSAQRFLSVDKSSQNDNQTVTFNPTKWSNDYVSNVFGDNNPTIEKIRTGFEKLKTKYRNKYEEMFGLDMVKGYYDSLQELDKSITGAYERRRLIQQQLYDLQNKLREIRFEMDKLPRNSDNFITLFTKEHRMLKDEERLLDELKKEEETERKLLTMFSEKIRKSYQIELERQLKQKNLGYMYYIISSSLMVICYLFGKSNIFKRKSSLPLSDPKLANDTSTLMKNNDEMICMMDQLRRNNEKILKRLEKQLTQNQSSESVQSNINYELVVQTSVLILLGYALIRTLF